MKFITAQEYCERVFDGTHASPSYLERGFPLVTSKHLKPYGLDLAGAKRISKSDFDSINKRSQVSQWDILFSMIGTVGRLYLEKSANISYAVKNIGIFSCKNRKKAECLFYYLQSPIAKRHIETMLSGAVQQFMSLDALRNFPVPENLIEYYPKIHNLSLIDYKIELNNRINDYLVNLSKCLIQIFSASGNLKTVKLADIATFDSGYSYKSTELQASTVAMATIGNFTRAGNFKIEGFKEIQPSSRLKESQLLEEGDIVVAHTDVTQNADIIGRAVQILNLGGYDKAIYSCDLVKVTPKTSFNRAILAALLSTQDFKNHCLGFVNGTTVLHLSKKALPEYECLLPEDPGLLKEYSEKFEAITSLQRNLSKESLSLKALRDMVLPKLLTGEIKLD